MSLAATNSSSSRSEGRLLSLALALAVLITLAPVARLFLEGITAGGSLNLGFFSEVVAKPATLSALRHSLVTAGLGTVISVLIGGTFAFLVALTDLRRKGALVFCLMIPMMIPPQITALSWTQVLGPSSVFLKTLGLAPPLGAPQPLYSSGGIIFLLGIQHTSIIFLTLRAGLRAIPQEVVEAARISGAKGFRIWGQIVLPLSLSSLLAGIAITFVTALGNFGIPAMLGIPAGYSTLPTLIYQRLASMGTTVLAEVAVLAMLIGLVATLGILLQRFFQRRQRVHLVGSTGRPLAIPLGKARLPVEIALWTVICAILVLPMLGLLATSLVPAYGVPLRLDTISLSGWHEALFRQPVTQRAFVNSFALSISAATLLMALCLPLAWLMDRHKTPLGRAFDSLLDLPYALPGVVLAYLAGIPLGIGAFAAGMAFAGLTGGAIGLIVSPEGYPTAAFFAVSVMVLTYHLFSEWLSLIVKTRSSQSVKRLLDLQPETARVVTEDGERDMLADQVEVGMRVRIRPGERIPLDGEVVEGDPKQVKRQRHTWTFARRLGVDDPNWQLIATEQ